MKCTMPRSLKVKPDCIDKVKLAVQRNGFPSQRSLAEEVGLSLTTVSNFLIGKALDYLTFAELCQRLELHWNEIANLKSLDVLLNPRGVKDRFINAVMDSESSLLLDY
jgi:hypothetical protein